MEAEAEEVDILVEVVMEVVEVEVTEAADTADTVGLEDNQQAVTEDIPVLADTVDIPEVDKVVDAHQDVVEAADHPLRHQPRHRRQDNFILIRYSNS